MKVTVPLQDPFSYAFWPIVLLVLILIGIIVAMIIMSSKKRVKKAKKEAPQEIKVVKPIDSQGIKNKYLKQLDALEMDFRNQKLSLRKTYQKMSILIRDFVKEMTGIKVNSYTLKDIQALHMPDLENLIGEFYSPEFSIKSEGDVLEAFNKTRRIIEGWN